MSTNMGLIQKKILWIYFATLFCVYLAKHLQKMNKLLYMSLLFIWLNQHTELKYLLSQENDLGFMPRRQLSTKTASGDALPFVQSRRILQFLNFISQGKHAPTPILPFSRNINISFLYPLASKRRILVGMNYFYVDSRTILSQLILPGFFAKKKVSMILAS